jgi:hypothetical protein
VEKNSFVIVQQCTCHPAPKIWQKVQQDEKTGALDEK